MNEYPPDFVTKMQHLPMEDVASFFNSITQTPVVSVRLNPYKSSVSFASDIPVEWCADGRYLLERPSFTFDPLFHAGAYYVQESSSMFLHHLLQYVLSKYDKQIIKALDLCAAPGGKSTLLSAALRYDDLLVCNEVIKSRTGILDDNMAKWGVANAIITQNDPSDFSALANFFDFVLVDAPCSGEGLFRKDKNAMNEWSNDLVNLCSGRQRRILTDIAPCIKEGGYLVYSTCTFNTDENEEIISWLQAEKGFKLIAVPIPDEWPVTQFTTGCYRFLPHRVKGEGLFMALMQKQQTQYELPQTKRVNKKIPADDKTVKNIAHQYLQQADDFFCVQHKGQLQAIRQSFVDSYYQLGQQLHLVRSGIRLGELNGNIFKPHYQLAWNNSLKSALPRYELDKAQAIAYLRKDLVANNTPSNKEMSLLTYQGLPLGWGKALSGRWNNYYPNHLRILKTLDDIRS